jgi:phosphopantothenoylcysteine decarboxylase/phosphopantothenate--cysteine ligase
MYHNRAVQKNIAYLKSIGIRFIGPEVGELSSLITGEGRMSEPAAVLEKAKQILIGRNDLQGRRVIVTAGPTREPFDPVRYISNYSSGKMGYAMASASAGFGANVTLISGPANLAVPPGVNALSVETASEMLAELRKISADADFLFMVAAVADFKPASFQKQKIKRTAQPLKIPMEPNPDILKSLGDSRPRVIVGFALETENLEAQAYQKLRDKKVDLIVANNPLEKGAEFGSDYNRVTLVGRGGKPLRLARMNKFDIAVRIIEESLKLENKDVRRRKK